MRLAGRLLKGSFRFRSNVGPARRPALGSVLPSSRHRGCRFAVTAALLEITRPSSVLLGDGDVFREDGEQRNRGLELMTFGEPLPGLRLLGGATFLDAEQVKTEGGLNKGNDVPGAPERIAKLGAERDVSPVDGLTFLGLVVRQGGQAAENANTAELDGWTRLDLCARYALTESVTLRARQQRARRGVPGGLRSDHGIHYNTGAPRTFILSGTVRF